MKRILTLLIACAALSAWANQVDNTAGSLSSLIEDNTITQLSITGTMDARDFKFISDKLNELTAIDLSNAQIVAYSNETPLFLDVTSYEDNAIPPMAFFGKKLNQATLPTGLEKVGMGAFAGCERLENLNLPESLKVIEPYAFSSCKAVNQVTTPAALTQLGEGAFSRCDGLEAVNINPNEQLIIGKDAFLDCKTLANVNLGENVTAIGPGAFSGCKALKTPTIAQNSKLNAIAEAAFVNSGIESIALEDCSNLSSIGMWAFANTPLKNITLPESLESLGDGAFYYNLDMEEINIPNGITNLSNYLLAGNNNIFNENVVNDDVTSIGDYAFYNWDQISTFHFPENVEYIGTKAMAGQTGLTTVFAAPTTVPELGDSVWAGVDQPNIPLHVDKSVIEDYRAAEQWKEFKIESPTDVEKITNAITDIKAFFSGTILNITATKAIANVSIFDTKGVLLSAATPGSEKAQLDTSNFSGKLYIVNVVLTDGTKRAFKLVR